MSTLRPFINITADVTSVGERSEPIRMHSLYSRLSLNPIPVSRHDAVAELGAGGKAEINVLGM